MRISTFSVLVGIILVGNVLIGVGEYYNDVLMGDFENLTMINYGNLSKETYSESSFNATATQLEENPTQEGTGNIIKSMRSVFFGIPDLMVDVLAAAGYSSGIRSIVGTGIGFVFTIIYLLFGLQIVSYFRGGGD